MKAQNSRFVDIIMGNKQFVIPVFQRDYSWTTEQCHQMWDDILRASYSDAGHFIGGIVYVAAGTPASTFQKWFVIDGQQRLATLTLLLAAMKHHISETRWSGTEDSPNVEKIDDLFLKNAHETGDRRYKLALRRADDDTLHALLDGKTLHKNRSELIIQAYEYFRDRLSDPKCELDTVYRGINRLSVVDVTLERHVDNPQLVFESMNSTGVDLSQSDLVRNYLLMGLDEPEQTRLYDDYWHEIEVLFKASSEAFDSFLRDYIALKELHERSPQSIRLDRVYGKFKTFWRSDGDTLLETLLRDMVHVARFYASFRGLTPVQPEQLADPMANIRKIGTTPGLLVMLLYDCHDKDLLSLEDFAKALSLIESYILRRDVLGLSARDYWSIFARVAHDTGADFKSFQVTLALLQANNRFPEDDEFRKALEDRSLYGLRNCKHILDRLENGQQGEPSPVHDYSIEHIMPQEISEIDEWQRMLGDGWEKIHDNWVHRLGNLTLTAYNSRYSNKPFEDKKTMKGGFRESAVRLNGYVREQDEWTKTQISERGRLLAEHALQIWPHHEADQAAVLQVRIRNRRDLAAQNRPDNLEMTADVRRFLDATRQAIRGLNEDVIEIVENKSVCCYGPEFFVELLPMKYSLRIILPLVFDDVEVPDGLYIDDISGGKRVPNRVHLDCDLLVEIWQEDEVAKAIPIIRQAFNRQGL